MARRCSPFDQTVLKFRNAIHHVSADILHVSIAADALLCRTSRTAEHPPLAMLCLRPKRN